MLRNLVLAGAVAIAAACLPQLYESNPALFENLVGAGKADAIDAAQPAVAAAPKQVATVALTARNVRIPADAQGHFRADFRLNGRPIPAMIDTGASVVAINRSTARRIGISLSASDFTGIARTANGETRAAPVTIDRIQIGRLEFRDVPAMVLEDRALSGTLIGMSFLNRLARYRVEDRTMVLEH